MLPPVVDGLPTFRGFRKLRTRSDQFPAFHRVMVFYKNAIAKAQTEIANMTRGMRVVALVIVVLTLLGTPVCGQQNRATAQTDGKSKSAVRKIYDEDQEDRTDEAGDARRREQVRRLIRDGQVQSGDDYYYAAFIFQHGQKPPDYLFAHVLAVTALSKGFQGAMWLSAATLDRYLHSIKQPQVFGTQFESLYNSNDDQGSYDKEMVSDTLRTLWCVAPYSVQAKILSDVKAGKGFRSTRICHLP